MKPVRPWFLYIVECTDKSLYTGITTELARRMKQHNAGRGARYTATRRPVKMRGAWEFPDRGSAMKAEIAVKTMLRTVKLELVESASDFRNGSWVEHNPDNDPASTKMDAANDLNRNTG